MVAALHSAQAHDSDADPVGPVGQPADGNGDEAVEQCEVEAADQAELAVGDVQSVLDRLGEDRQQLPIQEVQDVDETQDAEHDPGACGRQLARGRHDWESRMAVLSPQHSGRCPIGSAKRCRRTRTRSRERSIRMCALPFTTSATCALCVALEPRSVACGRFHDGQPGDLLVEASCSQISAASIFTITSVNILNRTRLRPIGTPAFVDFPSHTSRQHGDGYAAHWRYSLPLRSRCFQR